MYVKERLAILLLLLAFPAGLLAQAVLSPADKAFVDQATIGGTQEMQLSTLAAKRSSDPDVKRYARRLLDDHSAAAAELKTILAHKNVSAPDDILDPEHTMAKASLRQAAGADFDRAFLALMQKDHQQALALFQKEASAGGDPDIQAFAARQIATLQQHLAAAQTIAARYSH